MSSIRKCAFCGSGDTPMWRLGPKGQKTLCNACGIKWRRFHRNSAAIAAAKALKTKSTVVKPSKPKLVAPTASDPPCKHVNKKRKHQGDPISASMPVLSLNPTPFSQEPVGRKKRKNEETPVFNFDEDEYASQRDPCMQILDRLQFTSTSTNLCADEVIATLLEEIVERLDFLQAAQRRTEKHIHDIAETVGILQHPWNVPRDAEFESEFQLHPLQEESVADDILVPMEKEEYAVAAPAVQKELAAERGSVAVVSSPGVASIEESPSPSSSDSHHDTVELPVVSPTATVEKEISQDEKAQKELEHRLGIELSKSSISVQELQQKIKKREDIIDSLPKELASNWKALITLLEGQTELEA